MRELNEIEVSEVTGGNVVIGTLTMGQLAAALAEHARQLAQQSAE